MFDIGKAEGVKLRRWSRRHDKTCIYVKNQGASGGRTTYSFTPTTLGVITVVSCACGKKCDITDYDSF